jgi:transposase
VAQRWILARLRNETFFSLQSLNTRIHELLDELNLRPMKRLGGKTRRELFESLDRPALKALPEQRFVCAEWRVARVHGDYHIEVDRHCYSVPYALHRERLDVCLSATTVEVLYRGNRVASHVRSYELYGSTTLREHMPPDHRAWADADPAKVIAWAEKIGANTTAYVKKLIDLHPTGLRSALGVKRVAEGFDATRIEAACEQALRFDGRSYRPVQRILKLGMQTPEREHKAPIRHGNVRGPGYFH